MNKNHKKMGFFQKSILAISDFRFYPLMLKVDKMSSVVGHFLVFMLIITGVMSISFYNFAFDGIDKLLDKYDDVIPEFTLKNGSLDVENQEIYKVMNDFIIVLDTNYNYEELTDLDIYKEYDIYDNRVYISSDAITYESDLEFSGKEEAQVPQQIPLNQINDDYDKETLKEYILSVRDSSYSKTIIFISLFIATFLVYVFSKIFEIFLYSIVTSLVATISGIKLSFKNYVKIAFYVITLPYILETISIVWLGKISEATFIVSNLLAYVYILYAIRAVKLDAFILIMNNPNKIKKSKDGKSVVSVDDLDKKPEENDSEEPRQEENRDSEEKQDDHEDNNTQN